MVGREGLSVIQGGAKRPNPSPMRLYVVRCKPMEDGLALIPDDLLWLSKVDAAFALGEKIDRLEVRLQRIASEADIPEVWKTGKLPSRIDPANRRETQVGLRRDQIRRRTLEIPGAGDPVDAEVQERTGRFGASLGDAVEEHIEEARRNSYWRGAAEASERARRELLEVLSSRLQRTG